MSATDDDHLVRDPRARTPPARRATYRLQLTPTFGFADAQAQLPYLVALGVSHVYLSPVLQAQAGSTHGYDVIDHLRVNADLGGEVGFAALCAEARVQGLELLIDIVPNHMAVATPGNRWWMDVLANGHASDYAGHFDIDWDPPEAKLLDKVLVPVLGDHYGRVLEAGELRLVREDRSLFVGYYDHRFPLDPRSMAPLVQSLADELGSEPLAFLARSFRRLPEARSIDPDQVDERRTDGPVLLRAFAGTLDDGRVRAALDAAIDRINADVDALDALLSQQNFRLARWKVSDRELDYRRFFDVDNLVGLRTEDPAVFDEVHDLALRWVAEGWVDGLRIDHIDGLRDPAAYLARLRDRAPDAWLLVEKILEPGEELRRDWPIQGTTGYEFATAVGGLFVDPAGEKPLTDLYAELTGPSGRQSGETGPSGRQSGETGPSGESGEFEEVLDEAKYDVLHEVLVSEVNRLTEAFVQVCEHHRRFRDFSRHELHETVREVLTAFPVYRTYVTDTAAASTEDVEVIARAVGTAVERRPDLDPELFALLQRILAADPDLDGARERELRARFQQSSGAVMAKSKEDTAFYRYSRFVGLNEVGGDPTHLGVDPATFHQRAQLVAAHWPETMLALTTHDTKRTEDVRARLALLSEIPERWGATVRRWFDRNARHRGAAGPDPATEYLIYQTLVGAHPLPVERAWPYFEKAVREAKRDTSWVAPDVAYESDLRAFVDALAADTLFQQELESFVAPLVGPGRVNALAQKLVQLTAPGVPDIYQGQELWDLSLVDPDNRRAVDFDQRASLLDAGPEPEVTAGIDDPAEPGATKLLVVTRALALRRERPEAFGASGSYDALTVEGPTADHVVAYRRGDDVVVVVPRLVMTADPDWPGTTVALPPGEWSDALHLTDRTWSAEAPVAQLLGRFPVALLVRRSAEPTR